jgi:HEAT repeat protein
MNEVNNPGEIGPGSQGAPSFPQGGGGGLQPQPPMDLGEDWGAQKINRGNRGMIIVFLLILAAGGVAGFLWYENHLNLIKWEKELAKALALPDGEFEAAMRSILEKGTSEEILAQAALELGEAKDVGSVEILAKAVSRGGKVGREAAKALAKIGGEEAKVGINPIFNQMQKNEELAKAEYAWALCMLGDDRGFAPLLEAIGKRIITQKSLPEFNPDVIVQIGTTDKLIQMAESPDPMLRMYAAMELGFRTDGGDTVGALLKLIKDDNLDVAEAAAISLGRTTDARSGPALLQAMETKKALRDSILSAITQSVGAPGLEMIYKNMKHADEKYKVIGKFKKIRDPRSADFLLTVVSEDFPGSDKDSVKQADEIRNQALWILEDLGDPRVAEEMYKKTQWEPISEEAIPDPSVRYRQDDMSRKIANGVVSWFGKTLPNGAADYLMRIYKENEPYSNTPECAKRVKVDIGPLMDAMGRTGDQRFCSIIKPYLDKDEGFFFQAASYALARLDCPGTAKDFISRMQMTKTERKEEKFATLLESRDWQMEDRLQERRNSIMALKFLGSPEAGKKLMEIVLDVKDDQELRKEAAISLAYCSDDEVMNAIIEKLSDESIDIVARAALVQGLWLKPNAAAVEAMFKILEGSGTYELVKPAAIVIGEAADPANQERLVKLLGHSDEHRVRAAIFALMLGGDVKPVADRIIEILKGQEAKLVIRDWYETHPLYLTKDMVESKRIYRRLINARILADKTENTDDELLWPWKYLMERVKNGWEDGPGGLTALQMKANLMETVRKDAEYRVLAANILSGMNERGVLLALQSEKGPQGTLARDILRRMNVKSQ